jgi:hypothetical protein
MTLFNPNYLPKAQSPSIITLEVKALIDKFEGNTKISSLTSRLPE